VRYDELPALDFIYVDGGHDSGSVETDCLIAHHKLVSGGMVLFHDYGTIPDVQPVADRMMAGFAERIRIVNRLAVFRSVQ
jgi:hypothetical protein